MYDERVSYSENRFLPKRLHRSVRISRVQSGQTAMGEIPTQFSTFPALFSFDCPLQYCSPGMCRNKQRFQERQRGN